jgi:hypothetical protein
MQQPFDTALLGHRAARHRPSTPAERTAQAMHDAGRAVWMKRALARLRATLSVRVAGRSLSWPF